MRSNVDGSGLVRGIRGPTKVRDRDVFSQLAAVFLKDFFHSVGYVRKRTVERDTSDVDGAVRRKVHALDCNTWAKFDDIACRDPVAYCVGLFLVEAVSLKDFVDLIKVRLVGREKA